MALQSLHLEPGLIFSPVSLFPSTETEAAHKGFIHSCILDQNTLRGVTLIHPQKAVYLESIKTIMKKELPGVLYN